MFLEIRVCSICFNVMKDDSHLCPKIEEEEASA